MGVGHIFVSYNSADKPFADDLVRVLESGGLRIWYAPRDVRPGIDYSEQIQKAIETASAFVVIVTETSNRSNFVRAETEMAFSRRRPIFPVRTSPIAPASGLALFLQLRHWTDLFGASRQSAIARLTDELVAAVRGEAGSRRSGPTLFRPRRRRMAEGLAPGPAPRSYAPAVLIIVGACALVLALFLAFPRDPQADLQARGTAATAVPGETANGIVAPGPGEPNYGPLLENWMRYARDTAPPPLDVMIDNHMDMGMDMNGASDTGNAATESPTDAANEVDGM